jgi:hypothetical protein
MADITPVDRPDVNVFLELLAEVSIYKFPGYRVLPHFNQQ